MKNSKVKEAIRLKQQISDGGKKINKWCSR
jgi:hypothetical protein